MSGLRRILFCWKSVSADRQCLRLMTDQPAAERLLLLAQGDRDLRRDYRSLLKAIIRPMAAHQSIPVPVGTETLQSLVSAVIHTRRGNL